MGSWLLIFVIAGAPQTVLILGAGLTGLVTASFLIEQGHRITLLDFPRGEEGYRTNGTDGMPITFGGYRETSRLLCSIKNGSAQADRAIPLEFRLADGHTVSYHPSPLPRSLQWIIGLLRFRGLARHDRWQLLSYLERIWEGAESLPADLDNRTADEWLTTIGQSSESRKYIWNPLSRWMTGNDLHHLAGSVFVQQLSVLFLRKAQDASLTYRQGSVGDRLMSPIRHTLERQGVRILRQTDLPILRIGPSGIEEIRLLDGGSLRTQWYIAALPPQTLLTLLPEQLLARYAYFAQLAELKPLPEVTVEFQLLSAHPSPRLILLPGEPFTQLVIGPSESNQMMCRLSTIGNSTLVGLRDDLFLRIGRDELQRIFPDRVPHDDRSGTVLRDDQAALSLHPGATLRRPLQQSPLPNLLLAGPWTDTGWPANIESAIASARRCADIIRNRIAN